MTERGTDSSNWGGRRPGAGAKKRSGKTTKTVSVSLPIGLAEWLSEEAGRRGLSQSRIVALALEEKLKEKS